MALYLFCVYSRQRGRATGEGVEGRRKKLDMGKSCLRFKKLEDVPSG